MCPLGSPTASRNPISPYLRRPFIRPEFQSTMNMIAMNTPEMIKINAPAHCIMAANSFTSSNLNAMGEYGSPSTLRLLLIHSETTRARSPVYSSSLNKWYYAISPLIILLFLQQCDIPEHYKEFKDAPKVDVMSFLGIKRAEPIQVQRDWD